MRLRWGKVAEGLACVVDINFRALRTARGLSQEEVAELTGVSQLYVSGLERGRRNPTVLTLQELCSPLGAEPQELLRRSHGAGEQAPT